MEKEMETEGVESFGNRTQRSRMLQRAQDDPAFQAVLFGSCRPEDVPEVSGLPSRVLVTGSSGHLGAALVAVLQQQAVEVVGLDLTSAETTTFVGSITDAALVARAIQGCRGVFHTAALHAPDSASFTEAEFEEVNIHGTSVVLQAAECEGRIPVVHTSTTSLMITASVTDRIAAGETVWLNEEASGTPRNKYGRTKKAAEELCAQAQSDVVILRAPRFFPEDSSTLKDGMSIQNDKVNELLGRRIALEDVVEVHLRAMVASRLLGHATFVLGPDVPFPSGEQLTWEKVCTAYPSAETTYRTLKWQCPGLDRVYDSTAARQQLDWHPRWTFASVLDRLSKGDPRALAASF